MTELEHYEAIYLQWKTAFEALQPTVPYFFDNEESSPPASGSWATVSVRPSVSEQTTMGSAPHRRFERRGRVMVQLFAPRNSGGVATLAGLVSDARKSLEGVRLGELVLHGGSATGITQQGGWAMVVVSVEYRFTETR